MKKIPILIDENSSQAKLYWDIANAKILSGYGHRDIECPACAVNFDVRPVRALAIPHAKKSTTGMSLLESITADLEGTAL